MKMEPITRELLERARSGADDISDLQDKIARAESSAATAVVRYGDHGCGHGCGVNDLVGRCGAIIADLRDQLTARRRQHFRDIAAIMECCAHMDLPQIYADVMWYYYVDGMTIGDIAHKIRYSYDRTRRILHGSENHAIKVIHNSGDIHAHARMETH